MLVAVIWAICSLMRTLVLKLIILSLSSRLLTPRLPVNARSSQFLRKATTGPTLPTSGPAAAPGYLTHTAMLHRANPIHHQACVQYWKPPSLILNYARTQNCPTRRPAPTTGLSKHLTPLTLVGWHKPWNSQAKKSAMPGPGSCRPMASSQ